LLIPWINMEIVKEAQNKKFKDLMRNTKIHAKSLKIQLKKTMATNTKLTRMKIHLMKTMTLNVFLLTTTYQMTKKISKITELHPWNRLMREAWNMTLSTINLVILPTIFNPKLTCNNMNNLRKTPISKVKCKRIKNTMRKIPISSILRKATLKVRNKNNSRVSNSSSNKAKNMKDKVAKILDLAVHLMVVANLNCQ